MARKSYELVVWKYVGKHNLSHRIPVNTSTFYKCRSMNIYPNDLFVSRKKPSANHWSRYPTFYGYSIPMMLKYPYLQRLLEKSSVLRDKSCGLMYDLQLLSPDKFTFTHRDKEITLNVGETLTQDIFEPLPLHQVFSSWSFTTEADVVFGNNVVRGAR